MSEAAATGQIGTLDFRLDPSAYRHWQLRVEPPLAFLTLDVAESGGLSEGYTLKQNSYDLGVDIELYDAIQRLRFEHPEVHAVVVESARERIFCAGANIGMLGGATHHHKVNFCKFTNETRLAMEDASASSGQRYLCAVRGTAAGGGYELAMACDHIVLADDGSSSVSLPEVPLLGVLPGTGGLTRLVDKRRIRRDRADIFCTLEEGIKGQRALDWGLVDELSPRSRFDDVVRERALEMAGKSDRPGSGPGIELTRLERSDTDTGFDYPHLRVELDRQQRVARLTLLGPNEAPPASPDELVAIGDRFWPLALARQLEDAILQLRFNEPELGLLLIESHGDPDRVAAHDAFLRQGSEHWLVREVLQLWQRTLKRLDVSARSLFALVEPGSCFVGLLAELVFATDRSYMFEGEREDDPSAAPIVQLSELNFGTLPMPNGLGRLATRFLDQPETLAELSERIGEKLDAEAADELGLVTMIFDDIDWDDEVRIAVEERVSFSADALTGMEASLRFPGPETLESKVFGRLSAWQNWIFQRPNAVGEEGALRLYGTGKRPIFDPQRV